MAARCKDGPIKRKRDKDLECDDTVHVSNKRSSTRGSTRWRYPRFSFDVGAPLSRSSGRSMSRERRARGMYVRCPSAACSWFSCKRNSIRALLYVHVHGRFHGRTRKRSVQGIVVFLLQVCSRLCCSRHAARGVVEANHRRTAELHRILL